MFSINIEPRAKESTHKNYLILSHVNPSWKPSFNDNMKTRFITKFAD